MTFHEFTGLMEEADRETRHLSGGYQRNRHVRRIIEEADENTIAFTCLVLDRHVHLAFAVLYELVPEEKRPPIPNYYAGRIPVLQACWQFWALKEGHVKIQYDPRAYWVEDRHGNKGNWH